MRNEPGYMTLRQAAESLGIDASPSGVRRFRRALQAKERTTGQSIVDHSQRVAKVTLIALRRHCPELFDREDDMYQAISDLSVRLQEQVDQLRARVARLESRPNGRK